MKHVCKCRVCGGAAKIKKVRPYEVKSSLLSVSVHRSVTEWEYYYQCESCGMTAREQKRKSWARNYWNSDNADAQNLRELTEAIKQLRLCVQVADGKGRIAKGEG